MARDMRHNAVMQKPKIEVPPQDRLNLTGRSFGLGLGNTLRKPVDPGREETEKVCDQRGRAAAVRARGVMEVVVGVRNDLIGCEVHTTHSREGI